MSDKDIVEEIKARIAVEYERDIAPHSRMLADLRALADEVPRARRALKNVVALWDAEHPDDPCGCVGASDDCKHPPPCELCVARLISEGRTKELFED